MVVARVVGNDATVSFAQTGSLLELNVMLPVTAVAMLESITLLAAATRTSRARCIEGLAATERGPAARRAGADARDGARSGDRLRRRCGAGQGGVQVGQDDPRARGGAGIAADRLDELLDPAAMTGPGLGGGPAGG